MAILNKKEFESVLVLSAEERYKYSIKKIVGLNELWLISDREGYATYKDDSGKFVFPIWPHELFAQECCIEEYSSYKPERMELTEFLEEQAPEIEENGDLITMLPLKGGKGVIVELEKFLEDLDEELSKY